ncbi:MAG: FAD-binding oxidoreductase [Acidiphilium sp.]|nr:FAD-binding oxidoreductase [Acidiphilium sp.]
MDELVDQLRAILGHGGVLDEAGDIAPYGTDWRGLFDHRPRAVVRPADTAGVAAAVRLCAASGVAIVPQGGNTSMVGGAVPGAADSQIVLSLARMNAIRTIDRAGLTLEIEAGVTLRAAQLAAEAAGAFLPLSISAEGSAQIGGVISTNAGGNNTLRFGNTRDLVLGLEVVLPDGQIWNGLRRLRKDNTGYALRHLFAGAEGTLGIITAAVLRLAPMPRSRIACFCGLPGIEAVLDLYRRLRDEDEAALYAFEYISGTALDLALRHLPGARLPLERTAAHYALVELATTRRAGDIGATLETVLGEALDAGGLDDAAIANSEAQRLAFWSLREHMADAQKRVGASIKNDVSVPVAAVPALLARAADMLAQHYPDARMAAFGHIGDGNIHLNVIQPEGADPAGFEAQGDVLMERVNVIIADLGGSFSAEHGIGLLKRHAFAAWRGEVERDVMLRIKAAIDPAAIMNPGKIFEP